jgi:hypothetical protein
MSTTARAGTAGTAGANPTKGRWGLVAAALLLQLSIGGVYAWSVFSRALQAAEPFKLTKVDATIPFEVTIGMIFIGTFIGGRIQDRRGPKIVALTGAIIYSIGVIIASFARNGDQLPLLVIGYGVISGFGLGLAYIVPIAMLQKWFPDRRGLITRPRRRRLRLRRGRHRPHRPGPDRAEPGRPDLGLPAARDRLPHLLGRRCAVLQEPARGLQGAGLHARHHGQGRGQRT